MSLACLSLQKIGDFAKVCDCSKGGHKFVNRKSVNNEANFFINSLKTHINLLDFMLSRTLGVVFKVKHLFPKNHLLLSHITFFLVHFNSSEVIRSLSLKVSKSYQNDQVTSIKKLMGVPNSCHFITK